MSTATLLETLREAKASIERLDAEQYETELLNKIDHELSHPPGLTIGPATGKDSLEKGHVFEIELPSGHHVSVPATLDALVLLNDWIRNRENELEKQRKEKSRYNIVMGLGVGSKASPIQHDIDKAIVSGKLRKFTEDGTDVREIGKDYQSLSVNEQDELIANLMAVKPE